VARNALALPAHIFLLTGQAPHSELTSVRVARDVEQLRLTVEFSWQVAGDPAGRVLEGWLESVVRSPDAGTSPTPRVIAYGDHLRDEAEKIARRLAPPESEVTCEAEANLAAGAARWAAMCTEKRLHGCQPEISKLHVDHANPWEVGLVCANSGGAMFWHRLFARGQRLPTETVPLAAKGASPEEVLILAERRAEGAGASWLEQALWQENDLRWFTSAAPGAIEGGVVADLVVRLVHPSGRLEYGWSDPFVQARWLPRGATVESLSWA